MILEYNLGISKNSIWEIATPTLQAKKLPFYILEYGYFFADEKYYTKRIDADMYLMYVTISGKGLLLYDGKEIILDAGSIVVISCNKEHIYRTISDEDWEFKWIHFNGQAVTTYYNLVNPNDINVYKGVDLTQFIGILDKLRLNLMSQDLLHSLKASDIITELLTMLITIYLEESRGALSDAKLKIEAVTSFMRENYFAKIAIDDLASKCYYSKFHFIRFFKRQLGISPYEYLTNIRINKAKELLYLTQLSLSEIAEKTGFSDSKNFITNFRVSTSMTPGKYRKLYQRIEK